jgi:predicted nuclease of predicted toxin-antitoxin system
LDVVWVWEELYPTAPDSEILDYARRVGRAILTEDLDFSTLLALSGWEGPSLVTLRLSETKARIVARKILEARHILEPKLAEGYAITLEDKAIRFRKLPIR